MTEAEASSEIKVRTRTIDSIGRYFAWCGFSALLLALAFPMPGWRWIAWYALAPAAVLAVRAGSARRLAWTSFIVFFAWWLLMIRWLIPVTVGGYVGLSVAMAVYAVLAMLLLRGLNRGYPKIPLCLLLPMAWVTMELARGYLFAGGFGWLAIGHSQGAFKPSHGVSYIAQIADIFGVAGVSVLVAACSGMFADIITRPWVEYDQAGKRIGSKAIRISIGIWLLMFVASLSYGFFRVGQTKSMLSPGPVVGIVQTNIPQSNKGDFASEEESAMEWQRLVALTRSVATLDPKPDVIIWPETVVPANLNRESIELAQREGWFDIVSYHVETSELASELDTPLLVGAPSKENWELKDLRGDGQLYWVGTRRFNSAYLYTSDGKQHNERYDKMHRVPFGEYIPWVDVIPGSRNLFMKYFSPYDFDYTLQPGDRVVHFPLTYDLPTNMLTEAELAAMLSQQGGAADEGAADINGAAEAAPADVAPGAAAQRAMSVRAVTPICFEDTVPRVVRQLIYEDGVKQASLIINITNDGWFEGTHQPWQHLQHASFRNIEHRVSAARAVNTGCSSFVDSLGRVQALVSRDGKFTSIDAVGSARLFIDSRETVWGRTGHFFSLVMVAFTGLLAGFAGWRRLGRGLPPREAEAASTGTGGAAAGPTKPVKPPAEGDRS